MVTTSKFSTNPAAVPMPCWLVNTTASPLTWRYDGEEITFDPKEVVAVNMNIGVFFLKNLPALTMCTTEADAKAALSGGTPALSLADEAEDLSEEEPSVVDMSKPLEEMSYKELCALAKSKGMKFGGMKHEALLESLQASYAEGVTV